MNRGQSLASVANKLLPTNKGARANMTQEARISEPKQKRKPSPKNNKPDKLTPKKQKIIDLKTQNPDATGSDIARLAGTDISYTIDVLKRYGLTKNYINDFKEHKTEILTGLQHRILSSISQEDIQKASLQQKVTGYGIIHDKLMDMSGDQKVKPMVVINMAVVEGKRPEVIDVECGDVVNNTQNDSIMLQKNKPLEMIEE